MTTSIVYEFGYLSFEEEVAKANGYTLISSAAFQHLEQLCLNKHASKVGRFLKLFTRYGHKVLQVQNYVGVIFTPIGEHIEVLPKLAKKNDQSKSANVDARKKLLMMLRHLREFRYIETHLASIETEKMPLLEVFIQQFLHSVNQLVKRGLRSDYVQCEDNLTFLKGKLLVPKQLRHNLVNKHKFYVEYDEFLQNRPANRLIRAALKKVGTYTHLNANQRWIRELDFAFNDVPISQDVKNDFAQVKLNRGMSHYERPLAWAKLILEGFTPVSMKGEAEAPSLLFPMESVFESYVASVLKSQLSEGGELTTQASSQHLVMHNGQGQFGLKPDLLVTTSKGSPIVLDTKWKLVDVTANNFGLSQEDFYQMFAYGHKYLNGKGELFLIYPAHDDFKEPIQYSFDFSNSLKLWVVPFELQSDGKSQLKLKGLKSTSRIHSVFQ